MINGVCSIVTMIIQKLLNKTATSTVRQRLTQSNLNDLHKCSSNQNCPYSTLFNQLAMTIGSSADPREDSSRFLWSGSGGGGATPIATQCSISIVRLRARCSIGKLLT